MSEDKPNRVTMLPSERPDYRYGGALPPIEPDVGKLPALSFYERHPEWKPRRAPWRRTAKAAIGVFTMMPVDDSDIDDTPAADAGIADGVIELGHCPIAPDVLAAAFSLIVLLPDQKIFKSRLRGLANVLAAISEAEKRLAGVRASHDAKVVKDRAELAEREKKLRAREVEHAGERSRFLDTQKMLRERPSVREHQPDDDGWTAPAGSGMSRTFAPSPRTVRHDDLGQPYAAHTTLTRTTDAE